MILRGEEKGYESMNCPEYTSKAYSVHGIIKSILSYN